MRRQRYILNLARIKSAGAHLAIEFSIDSAELLAKLGDLLVTIIHHDHFTTLRGLIVSDRGSSPTVREGVYLTLRDALLHGRANAPLLCKTFPRSLVLCAFNQS